MERTDRKKTEIYLANFVTDFYGASLKMTRE